MNTRLHWDFAPDILYIPYHQFTNPFWVPLLQSELNINIVVESYIWWYKALWEVLTQRAEDWLHEFQNIELHQGLNSYAECNAMAGIADLPYYNS